MKPTKEQVLKEPAGARLDGWAAEFVLGLEIEWLKDNKGEKYPLLVVRGKTFYRRERPPQFSTIMAEAWKLVEMISPPIPKRTRKDLSFVITMDNLGDSAKKESWRVHFENFELKKPNCFWHHDESAPLTITKVAIIASYLFRK